jgi:hypothetical protein
MPFGSYRQGRKECSWVALGVGEAGVRWPAVATNLVQAEKGPLQHQKPQKRQRKAWR